MKGIASAVVLSVRPKYVEAIVDGSKHFEFRRSIFNLTKAQRVFIYCTFPTKKIVASFKVGSVDKDRPEKLWERYHEHCGIEEEDFFRYFEGCEKGYAIGISDLICFRIPIDPLELNSEFRAPMSFCYLSCLDDELMRFSSKIDSYT